jgi:hypothetical protein
MSLDHNVGKSAPAQSDPPTPSINPELVAALARRATIKRRIWQGAIWCWPVAVVGAGVAFAFVAGFVPPPAPSLSAPELAAVFDANRNGIRIGILIAMFATALMLPFFAVVSAEMKKIEGRLGLLAPIQFGGAIMLVMIFQIIGLAWLSASYRPEANPDVIRAFNDYCWFAWSTFIATYSIQYLCMAAAGFMDIRQRPIWPRWAAYLNLWVAITGAGGVLAVFFKTGPFAWNGIIGYWIPVIVFVVGMSVTTALMLRRARYEAGQPAGSDDPEFSDLALL